MSMDHEYILHRVSLKKNIGMRTFKIPYYKGTVDIHVADENVKAVVIPKIGDYTAAQGEVELVEDAIANPVGSKTLPELSKGKNKIVIVTSDHTRAVPNEITMPILLREIRKGNPDVDITILIGTGLHRATTIEEQRSMFGDIIVDNEKIVVSDAYDPKQFVKVCDLPSGAEFFVNKLAVECDLLITLGLIEPHVFAGFSGGRKSILPGISYSISVNENHSYKAIASPYAKTGILKGNPVNEDMEVAARAVNVQFILNVSLDAEKKIIAAFAGNLEKAFETGVDFIRSLSECETVIGDIVVSSNGGYPLDQNLYQGAKGSSTAEAFAGEDGVIIMCCSCSDGMGGVNFGRLITMGTPEEIDDYLSKIPPKETIPEQWCAQIYSRILMKHKLILVTTFLDHELVKKSNMIPAYTPDEALAIAYQLKGKDAKVVIVPDGVSVIPVYHDNQS